MKRMVASSIRLRKRSGFSQASSICPSPWPSPPKRGRGKEKIRVSSLAPVGGEGARRAGEGVARIFQHRQAARSDGSRGGRFGGNVSRLGSLALLLAVLLLSSCVVGPNYKRPTVQVPSEFRGVTPDQPATPESLADLKWFDLFQDDVLKQL